MTIASLRCRAWTVLWAIAAPVVAIRSHLRDRRMERQLRALYAIDKAQLELNARIRTAGDRNTHVWRRS